MLYILIYTIYTTDTTYIKGRLNKMDMEKVG